MSVHTLNSTNNWCACRRLCANHADGATPLIDLVDDRIIGHRIYRICEWCGSSDWWEASYYQNGAKCPVDWDWYRDD